MANRLITGYYIKNTLSFPDLEMIMEDMKKAALEKACREYKQLVSTQIERIVDEIALNQFQRPEDISILALAENEVRRKIHYASRHMNLTEFNLIANMQLLTAKIDDTPCIVLRLDCPNDIYSDLLSKKIPELVPFHLYAEDSDNRVSIKSAVWNELFSRYDGTTPVFSSLVSLDQIRLPDMNFKFHSKQERACIMAREKICSRLLSAYACEEEIAPFKLMDYMGQALSRLSHPSVQFQLETEEADVMQILPDISIDLITKIPSSNV